MKRKKIKILYTIPNFNTAGSGKALINVITRLDHEIFEPSICCRHERGELFKAAEDLGIPIYVSQFTAAMKPRFKGLRSVLELSKFFKKIKPDIIHSYNYSDDYSEGLAAKLSGIKWIYTKKNMGWGSNAWKIRTRISDAIIPQNEEMMETFFTGMDKLALIPIGINPDEFEDLKRDQTLIKKYDLEGAYPIILTIANIIPIKGINFLIRGFGLAYEDFRDARLLIVGEDKTEYAEAFKKEVESMGLKDKIIFTGKQSNIKSFFSIADLFMLSSMKTGEGGPISVLEAMASGVLSYGSDVPGIKDQFREFPDQLFESENPGSIANKIIHAMRLTEDERKERIQKQKNFVRKYYSIDNEITNLEKLYKKVAGWKD